jgi:hypothetical protein
MVLDSQPDVTEQLCKMRMYSVCRKYYLNAEYSSLSTKEI